MSIQHGAGVNGDLSLVCVFIYFTRTAKMSVKTHNWSVFFFLHVAIRLAEAGAPDSGLTSERGDRDKSVPD
jgi:hypothetical protein